MEKYITPQSNESHMEKTKSRITVLPKSVPGKWSLGLIVLFFLLYGLFMFLVMVLGQRGGDTFFSNLFLAVPGLLMAASGIAAFFTGIFGVVKRRERAILVFVSTAIGFFILLFCSAEILFPH